MSSVLITIIPCNKIKIILIYRKHNTILFKTYPKTTILKFYELQSVFLSVQMENFDKEAHK